LCQRALTFLKGQEMEWLRKKNPLRAEWSGLGENLIIVRISGDRHHHESCHRLHRGSCLHLHRDIRRLRHHRYAIHRR
jgi:hypothetical protein